MTTTSQTITTVYQSIAAGQSPTAADLATFTALMNGGWTVGQVTSAIEATPFVLNVVDPVIRAYQAAFGHVPDQASLNAWVATIAPNGPAGTANTTTMSGLFASLAGTAEFKSLYGAQYTATTVVTSADAEFIKALYTTGSGGTIDAATLTYWTGAHATVAQLLQGFVTSSPFVNATATSIAAFQNAEATGQPLTGSLFHLTSGPTPPPTSPAPMSVTGGANAETITGGIGNDTLDGGPGSANDVLDGGAGTNTVSYASATAGVTVSLALQGAAQNTVGAGLDTLNLFQNLTGSAFNDTLTGDANNNVIDGGAGNDVMDGGGGVNTASYASVASGVSASLALQGATQNTLGAGVDTLSHFQNLTGSAYNDILEGDGGANVLDGGGGTNTVSYAHAAAGVTVNLMMLGQAQNTVGAGTDTLSNFANIIGSSFNDTLSGGIASAVIDGGAGDDVMQGGADGTASYASATSGVTVSLAVTGPQNTGGAGTDTLSHFNNLTGSAFNDALEGDGSSNVLDGAGGINTVSYAHAASGVTLSLLLQGQAQNTVGAGNDTLFRFQNLTGSAFNDTLQGDSNNNVLNGGGGTNTAVFRGVAAQYTITHNSNGSITIADSVAGRDGTDTLVNIQSIRFSDRTIEATATSTTTPASPTGPAFTAYTPVDMTDVNFYRVTQGADGAAQIDNQTIGGVTYPNVLGVEWIYGGVQYESLFAGSGLVDSFNSNSVIVTGGTLSAYFEATLVNGQVSLHYAITGISYSAVTLFNAFQTSSTSDDLTAIQSMLSGANSITGSAGDDVLWGLGGNDVIDGGGGTNTAVFRGTANQYTVATANGVTSVTDNVAGRDGIDTLTNIQYLRFSDTTLTPAAAAAAVPTTTPPTTNPSTPPSVTPPAGVTVVTNLTSSQDLLVYQLYQAAYGRTPDKGGFVYWAGVADSTSISALTLAGQFLSAPEFTQIYGSHPSSTTYVTELYTHVLGRAPDVAGLAYWVAQVDAGQPIDQMLVNFATSPENVALIAPSISNGYWTMT